MKTRAFFISLLLVSIVQAALPGIKATKWASLDTIYSQGSGGTPETTDVTLRLLGTGDTIVQSTPVDVVLAFDLSGSMNAGTGTPSRWRITWAQISALTFLENLSAAVGDRAAILGWTANGDYSVLSDTANATKYYQHWFRLSSDNTLVSKFIAESLYIDGTYSTDVYNTRTLVRASDIPGGAYDDTPLNVSTHVALNYLLAHGNPDHGRVLIMLTDGENDDNVANSQTYSFVDSINRNYGIRMYSIGFLGGNVTHLTNLAASGGGKFYNAANPALLDTAFKEIAKEIKTVVAIPARPGDPMLIDVLPPGIVLVPGSIRATANNGTPRAFSTASGPAGTTSIQWFINSFHINEVFEYQYTIRSTKEGLNEITVEQGDIPLAGYGKVVYKNFAGFSMTTRLNQDTVMVIIPGDMRLVVEYDSTTPVAAGSPLTFTVRLIDLTNGTTITNPSYLPDSITVIVSDSSVINGRVVLPGDTVTIPATFVNGVFTGTYTAFRVGENTLNLNLKSPFNNQIYSAAIQRTTIPGAASFMYVVPVGVQPGAFSGSDTLVLGGTAGTQGTKTYELIITDAYGNVITDPSVLSGVTWSVTGNLDPNSIKPDPANPGHYTISALNYVTSASGTVTFTAGSISGSIQLVIFTPIYVLSVVTHERGGDTLDGFLDYLDVSFSETLLLDAGCVSSVLFISGHTNFTRSWSVSAVQALGVPAGSPSAFYRISLVPTVTPSGEPLVFETGFKPVVTFDNSRVASLNGSSGKHIGGAETLYETEQSMVTDSAAPVVACYKRFDNACNSHLAVTVKILFSEMVKVPAGVTLGSLGDAFLRGNPDGSEVASITNGDFTSITAETDPQRTVYGIPASGAAGGYQLEIALSSDTLFKEAKSRIRLNENAVLTQAVQDLSGNQCMGRVNRWAVLESGKDSMDIVCELTMTSITNRNNAYYLSWSTGGPDGDVPLFPWWGLTLVNPCRENPTERCPDPVIEISIFDLLGNRVADPVSHPSLRAVLDAEALWGNGGIPPTYKNAADVGIKELKACMDAGGKAPVCALYWNGLNSKGRLVAPGGYLIKRVIKNGVDDPLIVTEKLIVTNQKP